MCSTVFSVVKQISTFRSGFLQETDSEVRTSVQDIYQGMVPESHLREGEEGKESGIGPMQNWAAVNEVSTEAPVGPTERSELGMASQGCPICVKV